MIPPSYCTAPRQFSTIGPIMTNGSAATLPKAIEMMQSWSYGDGSMARRAPSQASSPPP